MPLDLIENALRAWVKTASGLTDEFVFFSKQKVEQPTSTYVTIHLMALEPVGAVDVVTDNYDPDRDPGVEIEELVEAEQNLTVSIQVFNGPITGANSALAIANRIKIGARLPSVNDALNEAGLGLHHLEPVRDLSALQDTRFEGRANLDAQFYVRESTSEFTTYIERAEITDYADGTVYVISES